MIGTVVDAAACGSSGLFASVSGAATFADSGTTGSVDVAADVVPVAVICAGADAAELGEAKVVAAPCTASEADVASDVFGFALPPSVQYAPPPITKTQAAIPAPASHFLFCSFSSRSSVLAFGSDSTDGVAGLATPQALQNFAFGLFRDWHL